MAADNELHLNNDGMSSIIILNISSTQPEKCCFKLAFSATVKSVDTISGTARKSAKLKMKKV